jgi:rhodanese-related sulfurtransferase
LHRTQSVKFLLLPSTLAFSASALVSGALLLWSFVGQRCGARAVTPAQATQLINNNNAIVIDVRDASDYALGSVTGARHIPIDELPAKSADLARFKNRPVVLVCASGARSAKGISALNAAGFAEVYNLAGGVSGWRDAGLPLVKPATKDHGNAAKKERSS